MGFLSAGKPTHTRATSFEDQLQGMNVSSSTSSTRPTLLGRGGDKSLKPKNRQTSLLRLRLGRSASPVGPVNHDKFESIMNRFWQFHLESNPEEATFYGIHTYDDRMGHCTEEQNEAVIGTCQSALRTLNKIFPQKSRSFTGWSRDQKVTFGFFRNMVEETLRRCEDRWYLMPLDSLNGLHTWLPMVIPKMNFETISDYEIYLKRLEEVPRLINEQIAAMKQGLQEGMTPPKVSLEGVADQIDDFTKQEPSTFLKPLNSFDKVASGPAATALQVSIKKVVEEKVLPAFTELARFTRDDYFPNLSEEQSLEKRLPNGKQVYANLVLSHTSTKLTPAEIHKIGLGEVKRIRGEMEAIAKSEGYRGADALDRYAEYVDTADEFIPKSAEELLDAYRAACMKILPELPTLFGKLPRTPFGVRAIPDFMADQAPGAFYESPSEDGKNPGWFSANCSNLNMRKLYNVEALVLHEGVPGHHLQLALAVENGDLPPVRKFTFCTAYAEGWGLYAESLGKELGLYTKPSSYYGRLVLEMLRACRLVVDTGMHHLGWSKEKAMEFMKTNKAGTEKEIDAETTRYLSMPGQALAYKIGELKIKELRKKCKGILKNKFDVREFHDTILAVGGVPLTVLEEIVMEWADAKKKEKKK